MCQTPDTLCFNDNEQYNLYNKLKNNSKKYSIHFETIHNRDLIRILNRYNTNFNSTSSILFNHIPQYNVGINWHNINPIIHTPKS